MLIVSSDAYQHIAASEGHEECVLVLLKHACNIHLKGDHHVIFIPQQFLIAFLVVKIANHHHTCMADINGNTALWDAIASKHHTIFRILYHFAALSDPYTAGELLCTAAKRNELAVMEELLKYGLNVDSKNHHGLTPMRIAMSEKNVNMVNLLVMNGAEVIINNSNTRDFHSTTLSDMLEKREVGYRITMPDAAPSEVLLASHDEEQECNRGKPNGGYCPRASIYKGHPVVRRETSCTEFGRLIRLPNSLEELKKVAGKILSSNSMIFTLIWFLILKWKSKSNLNLIE